MIGAQTYFMVKTTNRKKKTDWPIKVAVIFILDPLYPVGYF
jgi:hypothetical protein